VLGKGSRKSQRHVMRHLDGDGKLCPNYARQGQIFPNGSKRNQKQVKKLE
jgi:hypothetical protein